MVILARIFLITYLLLNVATASSEANADELSRLDLIECKRERADTRQFCYIKQNTFEVGVALPKSVMIEDHEIRIDRILKEAYVSLRNENKKIERLTLEGLEPTITFEIDWNNSYACARNRLWEHNIVFVTKPSDDQSLVLARINTGFNAYQLNLENLPGHERPWRIKENADTMTVYSKVSIIDKDFDRRLPIERIPSSCSMVIQNLRLSYSSESISQNLAFLQYLTKDKLTLLSQAAMIHANYVDRQLGLKCASMQLADTLRNVEDLADDDPLTHLSVSSIATLKSALMEAHSLGAFPWQTDDSEELWQRYVDTDYQNELKQLCSDRPRFDYRVSFDPFLRDGKIIHEQGYSNVQRFLRERDNLNRLLHGVWALIEASKVSFGRDISQIEIDWANDRGLYLYLN